MSDESPLSKTESNTSSDLRRYNTGIERDRISIIQHLHTVGSTQPRPNLNIPLFGRDRKLPEPLPDRELYVVDFDSQDDPEHPQNWRSSQKVFISAILIVLSFAATLDSSILSPASPAIEAEFNVGEEVATLGTSLFVLGYAVGPIVIAPLSELYGRRLPVLVSTLGFAIFGIGCATAKDYQTLMICRFFGGVFGASPLVVLPAIFADMFSTEWRGVAVSCFSATVFCGPFTGPFIGGYIAASYLGWRWTLYLPSIMGFGLFILAFVFQRESYPPVILVSKARKLRRLTRNWGIHAKQEEIEVDFKELITKNISRPLTMLFTEPILLLITLYVSFIYGLLFLSLTSYDIIFGEIYGFPQGKAGLPFLAAVVGILIAIVVIVATNGFYIRKLHANGGVVVPEWRLPLVMVGGISFAGSLFWLGWAGYNPQLNWAVPTAGGIFLGFGIYTIFLQCTNYIVDSYTSFAASAVAANAIMRSVVAAIFPMFATYMFEGMGVNWAMTLLGCIGVLFIPLPFVFYYKGEAIRARSKSGRY